MDKFEFMTILEDGIMALPEKERREMLDYYSEMIDDRIEDGLSEEEVVAAVGDVDEIIRQVLMDTPLTKLVKEKVKTRRSLRAWEIILLVLGSPVWLPILIAVAAVIFSVGVAFWALVFSFSGAAFAFAVATIAAFAGAIVFVIKTGTIAGLGMIGIALIMAGLAILFYFAAKAMAKGLLWLGKKTVSGIKRSFRGKERTK